MRSLSSFFVFSICLFQCARATPVAHAELEPVSDHDWPGMETRHTLMRRAPHHAVALQKREHFVWGGADNGNGAVFANMTLDASNHENKLILSMDRFVGKLKEVDCASNIRMKFTSNDTYADAIHQWDWVNFNEHRTFILVANYPGCADNNTREPWIVRNVRNEPETLTVHLDAKKSTWDEVSKGVPFKIDFGRHTRTTQPTIAKRFLGGLIDKAKDKVNDVKDTVTDVVDKGKDEVKETVKDVKDGANNIVNQGKEEVKETVKDVKDGASIVKEKGGDLIDKVEDKVKKLKEAVGNPNKQFTVNINKPLPERLFSKSINGLDLAVTCNGGYIKGSVVIMGTIHFDGKGIDSLVVEIEPRGVGIDVPLTLTATGVLGSGFNLPIDLGTLPAIPGFAVTGLFAIGPTLQLDAGFLVSAVTGSITLSTGFSASLNDGAKASFDLKKKKKVALSGWDATGKTKPFKVESAEVSVGAELYVSTGVYVEASIFDRFGGQAGLTIKAPVRIEVTGQYIANGEVCPNTHKDKGIWLKGTAGVEALVEAFGEVNNIKKSFFDQMVVNKGSLLTLPPLCFPIGKAKTPTPSAAAGVGGNGGQGEPAAPEVPAATSTSGTQPKAVTSANLNNQATNTQAASLDPSKGGAGGRPRLGGRGAVNSPLPSKAVAARGYDYMIRGRDRFGLAV